MNSTTKKLLIGAIIIIAIAGYIFWSTSKSAAATPPATTPTSEPTDDTTGTTNTTTGTGATSNTPPPAAGSTTGTTYKDGTYTGTAANSIYGDVQVSATISGGKLTDVTFLQAPNSQPHSVDVSTMSEPILKGEAIASQNATVNIVSGATQTSEAFEQTLQSALTQAQA